MDTLHAPETLDETPVLPEALLRRFDAPGPRYTSYPTADRFVETFGVGDLCSALELRSRGAPQDRAQSASRDSTPGASQDSAQGASQNSARDALPLSVYVHIPFCDSVCYYCACNKVITKHHERAAEYLDALDREIELVLAHTQPGQPVSQLHFGGGSPTFLSDAELQRVVASLRRAFQIDDDTEMSIEVDPRTVTPERLAACRALGFNRISFGVQDFDPQVQQAVHRVQPFDSVRELMVAARALGFKSINADLIYGLPRQTPESFAHTVQQIGELRPDRIALYAYAHLPQRFKPQRRIVSAELPSAGQRVAMLGDAIAGFLGRGYHYIGMDHFALPDDALAVAKHEARLHRNFQGYSTQPDCDLIGLGVSSIGKVGATYYQNAKTLDEYYGALQQGQLPVQRGIELNTDDLLRRDVIMALMCQGRLDFASIEQAHGIDVGEYFAHELAQLAPMVEAGLVTVEPGAVQVTATGWYVVRAVAATFDRWLQGDAQRERFSRMI